MSRVTVGNERTRLYMLSAIVSTHLTMLLQSLTDIAVYHIMLHQWSRGKMNWTSRVNHRERKESITTSFLVDYVSASALSMRVMIRRLPRLKTNLTNTIINRVA